MMIHKHNMKHYSTYIGEGESEVKKKMKEGLGFVSGYPVDNNVYTLDIQIGEFPFLQRRRRKK